MITSNFKNISVALALVGAMGAAHAYNASFTAVADAPFTDYFLITPTVKDTLTLDVTGLKSQFKELSFTLVETKTNTKILDVQSDSDKKYLTASFYDSSSTPNLNVGVPYMLTVMGTTKKGSSGLVTISGTNGSITPSIPEPETYALLLAGLGLVGAIARRRRTAA